MARILRSAGLSGLRFLAFRLSGRGSRAEPDQTLHAVDEIGEADLRRCPGDADGSDDQAHGPLLSGEDRLDRREPTRDFAALASAVRRGIGRPRGFLRWMHERMLFVASQASFFFDRNTTLPDQPDRLKLKLTCILPASHFALLLR